MVAPAGQTDFRIRYPRRVPFRGLCSGSLTFDGTQHLKYDAWNRLVEVRTDDNGDPGRVVASYSYDGRGYRTAKLVANYGDAENPDEPTGYDRADYYYNDPSTPSTGSPLRPDQVGTTAGQAGQAGSGQGNWQILQENRHGSIPGNTVDAASRRVF